jgi:hypothetical protein
MTVEMWDPYDVQPRRPYDEYRLAKEQLVAAALNLADAIRFEQLQVRPYAEAEMLRRSDLVLSLRDWILREDPR